MNWLFQATNVSNWLIVLLVIFFLAEREIVRRQGKANRHNARTGDNQWWAVKVCPAIRLSTTLLPSYLDGKYLWWNLPGTWFYFRRTWTADR